MSLLKEIRANSTNNNVDVSTILRQCKILAAKLGNENFKTWVERELNGYPPSKDLPDYRIITGIQSYGNFVGIGWSRLNSAPIPLGVIPKEYQDFVNNKYLIEPISYYSALVTQNANKPVLELAWPGDLIAYLSDKVFPHWTLLNAWGVVSLGSFVALLDTVRNRILSFALEIEAEAPDAGEAPPNEKPVKEERVQQVYNTYIQGGTTNIMSGEQNIINETHINIIKNDLESLKNYLKALKISEDDIERLAKAVEDDSTKGETQFGKKAQAWMGEMLKKAADGSWKIATSVAADLISNALMKYFGMSQ